MFFSPVSLLKILFERLLKTRTYDNLLVQGPVNMVSGRELPSQYHAVSAWLHVAERYHEGRKLFSPMVAAHGVSP